MELSSKISFQYSCSLAVRLINNGINYFSSIQLFNHNLSMSGFSGVSLFPRKKDYTLTREKTLSVRERRVVGYRL